MFSRDKVHNIYLLNPRGSSCYEKIALPARHFYYITNRFHEMYKPTAMNVTAPPQGLIANYVLVDVRKRLSLWLRLKRTIRRVLPS